MNKNDDEVQLTYSEDEINKEKKDEFMNRKREQWKKCTASFR